MLTAILCAVIHPGFGQAKTFDSSTSKNKNMNDETTGTVAYVTGVAHNHYEFRRKGVFYKVEKVHDQITSLKIDGRVVKGDDLQAKLPLVNSFIAEYDNIINTPLAGLGPLSGSGELQLGSLHPDSAGSTAGVGGLSSKLRGLKNGVGGESDLQSEPHAANYYGKGYRVVVRDSIIVRVYFHKTLLDSDGIKAHQHEIDAIYRSRK